VSAGQAPGQNLKLLGAALVVYSATKPHPRMARAQLGDCRLCSLLCAALGLAQVAASNDGLISRSEQQIADKRSLPPIFLVSRGEVPC